MTSSFSDMVDFSDEEGYGRYLDLHDCYEKYINLKGVEVGIDLLVTSVRCLLSYKSERKNILLSRTDFLLN